MDEPTVDPETEAGAVSPSGETAGPFDFAMLTHPGAVRPHNEDCVGVHLLDNLGPGDEPALLCLVADGMGGHQAGEVASQAAVDHILEQLLHEQDDDPGARLVHAFHSANRAIHEQAQADPDRTGMGTTVVAALIVGTKVYLANVGDSRAYLIEPGGAVQITDDHSWVQEQVRAGLLTAEQARSHPQRNLVTRALGSRPEVEVDLYEGSLEPGELLFLCSDGLSNELSDAEIAEVVLSHAPHEAAARLVEAANERGASDNVSVVIVRREGPPAAAGDATAAEASPGGLPALPFLIAVALILTLVVIGLFVLPRLLGGAP